MAPDTKPEDQPFSSHTLSCSSSISGHALLVPSLGAGGPSKTSLGCTREAWSRLSLSLTPRLALALLSGSLCSTHQGSPEKQPDRMCACVYACVHVCALCVYACVCVVCAVCLCV